jgi:hypothetical protein
MKKTLFLLSAMCLILFSCEDRNTPSPSANSNTLGSRTGGGGNGNQTVLSLGGTKWKLTQYRDLSMTNPQPRTDTLIFSDANHFTWNHFASVYTLASSGGSLNLSLFGSPFGDIGGMPAANFQAYGQIIDVPFTQLNTSNGQTYYLWFQKLP